jgi:hypothetical protein
LSGPVASGLYPPWERLREAPILPQYRRIESKHSPNAGLRWSQYRATMGSLNLRGAILSFRRSRRSEHAPGARHRRRQGTCRICSFHHGRGNADRSEYTRVDSSDLSVVEGLKSTQVLELCLT